MRNVTFTIGRHLQGQSNVQKVSFFYATTDDKSKEEAAQELITCPIKTEYQDLLSKENVVAAFNYIPKTSSASSSTFSLRAAVTSKVDLTGALSWGVTSQGSSWDTLTILRREIWEENGETKGEKYFSPVVVNRLTNGGFVDYNIANDRTYQYVFYPYLAAESQEGKVGWGYNDVVSTKWDYWSLTELHPTDDKYTFEASYEDVWLFKYNHTPSAQKHNFVKSEQKNLSAYPRFSQGTQNNINGDISCLLGSEIAPYNFKLKKSVPVVQSEYSSNYNLIYWASEDFWTGTPMENKSSAKKFGVYSVGTNQVILWGEPTGADNQSFDFKDDDILETLKQLLFNYYGTFSVAKEVDEDGNVKEWASYKTEFILHPADNLSDTGDWAEEYKIKDQYYFWYVVLPKDTSMVPTLSTSAAIYYATPGYQLGMPRKNSTHNGNYGTYFKKLTDEQGKQQYALVIWFKQGIPITIDKESVYFDDELAVQTFLKGQEGVVEHFYVNGYFQSSKLRYLKPLNPNGEEELINLHKLTDISETEWDKAVKDIPTDTWNSKAFYGFKLNPLIKTTEGYQEKIVYREVGTPNCPETEGGYTERLPFSERLTSNQKVDMLEAWRQICFSGNPKLLKDSKGQKFLVQITQSSNTPSPDSRNRSPDRIDFSWVEIGSTKNITVIGEREDR